jgi:putative DNA primase/helicase
MKQVLEHRFGYGLNRNKRAEIKEHIRNRTYKSIKDFDSDLNIINLENGLYNIRTGELTPHTAEYLSLNQKPIIYDKDAPIPTRFIESLRQIVYPSDIRTLLELMAYTFYRDNPFEILTILFGTGSNGKSVLFGVLGALHGPKNVSNVSLKAIIERPFALHDLISKDVNLDSELSSRAIVESAVLKKVTGRQPTRVEQKNQRAFDTKLHTKLWFSANKIPETADDSDAFFRRTRIIATPNTFQEGSPGYDPNLIDKLTTPESLAGIFNILAPILRRILDYHRIYLADNSIEDRRQKYEIAVNPIKAFLDEANAENAVASDLITKDMLFKAFQYFCKKHKLAVMNKITFGKGIAKQDGIEHYREPGGGKTMWLGFKLVKEYDLAVSGFYDKQRDLRDLV